MVVTISSSAASLAMKPLAPRLMKSITSSSSGCMSIMMMRACGAASLMLSTNRWLRLRPRAASTSTTFGLVSCSRCSAAVPPSADATTLNSVCESSNAARPSRSRRLSSITRIWIFLVIGTDGPQSGTRVRFGVQLGWRTPEVLVKAGWKVPLGHARRPRGGGLKTARSPPGPGWRRATRRFRALELHDVLRRRALLALHDLELHALAFGERLESLSLNRGVMYEAILAAVFGRDESKALGVVEPLYGTGDACHLFVAPGYAFERRDGRSNQKRHEDRRRTAPGPLRSLEAWSGGRMMSMAARG